MRKAETKASRRVGIVTYIHNANYGSILQCYALQEFVRVLGYEVEVIDYLDTAPKGNSRERRMRMLFGLLGAIRSPKVAFRLRARSGHARSQSEKKQRAFREFEQKHVAFSRCDYTLPHAYDAFICGSDQVWNLTAPGLNRTFFLRFAEKEKRISYAPSFGSDVVPSYNDRLLRKWLRGFKYLSVRERSGIKIVEEYCGVTPEWVLDPALLVGEDFWNEAIDTAKCALRPNEPLNGFVVGYLLSDSERAAECIVDYAKEKNLQLLWIDTGVIPPASAQMVTPSPIEFVRLIRDAECVATDSFHGLAFSLMFNRRFLLFNRMYEGNARQSTRIDSLLSVVGAAFGDPNGVLRVDSNNGVDWRKTNQRLAIERTKSRAYLENSLENACFSEDRSRK